MLPPKERDAEGVVPYGFAEIARYTVGRGLLGTPKAHFIRFGEPLELPPKERDAEGVVPYEDIMKSRLTL